MNQEDLTSNQEDLTSLAGASVNDGLGGGRPVSATPKAVGLIESLLRPFLDQSAPIRSIVAVGGHEVWEKVTGTAPPAAQPVEARQQAVLLQVAGGEVSALNGPHGEVEQTLDSLARQAREQSRSLSGSDLLLVPANTLNKLIPPPHRDFRFRAVAVVLKDDTDVWTLRRSLFDRGLICIGSAVVPGAKALCFLVSYAVCSFNHLHFESRGQISMSTFLVGSAIANQMFRYACLKLYALRHGLTPVLPAWEGIQLFGLEDRLSEGLQLRRVTYLGFSKKDREIWDRDEPLIDIDLEGYFQEIPECWHRHRPLLRRMFQLPPEQRDEIEAWRHRVTNGGRRTLVAVHVRRGDYRTYSIPYFRMVPEDWYLDWLRAIWPTLSDPILFVGTDEPDAILPQFQEFETVSAAFGAAGRELPEYVRDFEVMRQADYLAICNSSFGRMAAILAAPTQKCYVPSFRTQSFEPYEPWIDPGFWERFADPGRRDAPAIFLDVSDLLAGLLKQEPLSDIQRVECEILRNLAGNAMEQTVHLVFLNRRGEVGAVETSAFLGVIENLLSGAASQADIASEAAWLTERVFPCPVQPRGIFLSLGAFWRTDGMGIWLQHVKNSGARIGILIHDLLPVTAPEYFAPRETKLFDKGVSEALTFADFVLTTTEGNKASLTEYLASRKLDPLPIHPIPLGHGVSISAPVESEISDVVADICNTDYVLCAGAIEGRKNPGYLFNIWKMMARSGRLNFPRLVFAGRTGWLVQDFLDQLQACSFLGGKIVVVDDLTDVELDLLYGNCLLTMFPDFVDGSGVAVGESLAHGKICLSSDVGGISAAYGDLVDYIDPYNVCDGIEKLSLYLDDASLRQSRQGEISGRFHPRSWTDVADDLHRSVRALAAEVAPMADVAAIQLPRDQYLEISNDVAAMGGAGMQGALSAELICVAGWHPPERTGVRAAEAETVIRFRTDGTRGTRILLALRFAAFGRNFALRICPGSGDETELSLSGGCERLVVLPCQVERGNLVTVYFSSIGAMIERDEFPGASYWMVKGILYSDPKRISPANMTRIEEPVLSKR